MSLNKENRRIFSGYLRAVERAKVRKETHAQELEYLKSKPDKDHVVYMRNKLTRLIGMLDDKIEFYEDLMARFIQ